MTFSLMSPVFPGQTLLDFLLSRSDVDGSCGITVSCCCGDGYDLLFRGSFSELRRQLAFYSSFVFISAFFDGFSFSVIVGCPSGGSSFSTVRPASAGACA